MLSHVQICFGDIALAKAIFRKYLKDNFSSELFLQLSFKYLKKIMLYSKVIFKSMIRPDNTGQVGSMHQMGYHIQGKEHISLVANILIPSSPF